MPLILGTLREFSLIEWHIKNTVQKVAAEHCACAPRPLRERALKPFSGQHVRLMLSPANLIDSRCGFYVRSLRRNGRMMDDRHPAANRQVAWRLLDDLVGAGE